MSEGLHLPGQQGDAADAAHPGCGPQPVMLSLEKRVELRQQTEALLARAKHLPERDRFAFKMSYQQGLPITKIASILCVPEKQLRRSLEKIKRRISSRLWHFMEHHAGKLPNDVAEVARLFVFEGRSLRDIACRTRQPLWSVRKHITTLKEIVRWQGG